MKRPSILKMTVERPRDLYAFLAPMFRLAKQHLSHVGEETFEKAENHCAALSSCQCERTQSSSMAVLAFWWLAVNHEGTRDLVLACEPDDSWWKTNPESYDLLIRFVRAHIMNITSQDIDPVSAPFQARAFHYSMIDVLDQPPEHAIHTMSIDGNLTGDKVSKTAKAARKEPKQTKAASEAAAAEYAKRNGHRQTNRRPRVAKKKATPEVQKAQARGEEMTRLIGQLSGAAHGGTTTKVDESGDGAKKKNTRRAEAAFAAEAAVYLRNPNPDDAYAIMMKYGPLRMMRGKLINSEGQPIDKAGTVLDETPLDTDVYQEGDTEDDDDDSQAFHDSDDESHVSGDAAAAAASASLPPDEDSDELCIDDGTRFHALKQNP